MKYELNRSYNSVGVVYLRKSEASHSSIQYRKEHELSHRNTNFTKTTHTVSTPSWSFLFLSFAYLSDFYSPMTKLYKYEI